MRKSRFVSKDIAVFLILVVSMGLAAYRSSAIAFHYEVAEVPEWQRYDVRRNSVGRMDAPVVVVTFSDYECAGCADAAEKLVRLAAEFPTQVRLVYRHLPLTSVHRFALQAAEAAECAGNQGRFAELNVLIYKRRDSLAVIQWSALAESAGVADLTQFGECMRSGGSRPAIQEDVAAAHELKLTGTPAYLINGFLVDDNPPYHVLRRLVKKSFRAQD